jgi:tRNA nucleotidyltransferase/poly(A) polymerase
MTTPADPNPTKHATREDAVAVVKRLREAGHVAYFAGGCVRDMLLGLEPKDYDVATDAPPDRVRQLFTNTQAVGAAFGVILVRQRKSVIEVATFRTDLEYKDGRRPEGVVFTTAEEDAKRRDFTINGLFFDPIENKVIDYVGGHEDLKRKVIRAIGDPHQRLAEDHLRMLRAIRFAARFAFEIEKETLAAIRENAPKLAQISPERIGEELRAMLRPPTRKRAYALLRESGLMNVVMRFMPEKADYGANTRYGLLGAMNPSDGMLSFGAALAAIALDHRFHATHRLDAGFLTIAEAQHVNRALRQALKLSNEESDILMGVLNLWPLLADPTVARMKRFLATPTSQEARLLLAALAACDIMNMRITALFEAMRPLEGQEIAPPPLLTGDDLTAAGLRPGPVFKRVLDAVYDAQLEDRISGKEQALELALRLAKDA